MNGTTPDSHAATTELIGRAQAGDEAAFERLVRRYYGQIYRWALVRTGDPDDAEDVTQDVLVTLHRKLGRFDGRSGFSTWQYTVVRNTSTGFLRGGASKQRLKEKLTLHVRAADQETAPETEDATGSKAREVVRMFLRELPVRQREVFDLVDLQGYEPIEVSAMTGLKTVTVRSHLFRARQVLRRRILESHPELVEGYLS